MFGSISEGITEITGFLNGADCLSTISCFKKMGIKISQNEDKVIIQGKGLHGLSAPQELLDVGNSGTTTRLICGILAGQNFISELNKGLIVSVKVIPDYDEIEKIYGKFKRFFNENKDWSLFVITTDKDLEKKTLGRKADRRRKLYNGRLETCYYQFHGEK